VSRLARSCVDTWNSIANLHCDLSFQGKTVQTIAFFAWLKYRRSNHVVDVENGSDNGEDWKLPHLIVVPVSVLPNWMREFETFCPTMNVMKFYGSQQERDELKEELRAHHPKYRSNSRPPRRQLDVILTPVTYFQKESSSDRKFLAGFKYDYLVCDEAHMLKNASSARYKMLDKLQTQHRLLLTGTPVQNNPQELLNMLSFIMPLFSRSSHSFDEEKGNYSEQMLKHFVDEKLENGDEEEAYKKLKQLFAPFVLRRKKDDVIAQILPPKEQKVEFVTLDESARSVYQSILEAHVKKAGMKITAAIGDHLFTNLRKAAHHPLLLRNRHTSPEEVEHLTSCFYKYGAFQGEGCTKQRVGEELSRFNDFHIHLTALELIQQNPHRRVDLDRYTLNEEDLFSSAKFTRLRVLLPELVAGGHRILIFSSWTSCLDLLGCLMEHLNLEYLRMDGTCASDERQRLIDQFNTDSTFSIFLLSTRACGLGINLTSADTCIIHDLDFNPFNDLQAQDRCHRRGQTKKVTVYKLVASDTVDSDIYKMQEKKAKMNAAIMGSAEKNMKRELLQSAVDRYLTSPGGKVVLPDAANKENVEDDEILL
jgi:SWI/SNF-related matrix-associated actin-dependent regulator of chromatin subfamily A containing DEAD/H box 1